MASLSLAIVQQLLQHATAQASESYGKPICVSVCDAHGFMIGFARMDEAPVRSIELARQKAYTCTRMGSSTTAFLERLRREDIPIGYFCDPLLTAMPGGALLKNAAGQALGAVGVSGLAPHEDQALAEQLGVHMLQLVPA